jgi:predicted CxxxxCH...CXXCH cytochrome family protein
LVINKILEYGKKSVRFKLKQTLVFISAVLLLLLLSCSKDADPIPSVTHPPEWNISNSELFHGNKVLTVGAEFCTSCHGNDYSGGRSGIACADCHATFPHPPTWSTPGSDSSHAAYFKTIYWDMSRCQDCHGEDYTGGKSGVSCYDCHTNPGGPEACNTCHGSKAAPITEIYSWAPPKDLEDNLSTTAVGVGAHQTHLINSSKTTAYLKDCNLCHTNILSFDDPDHINGAVDMDFNEVATDSGRAVPIWSEGTTTCTNVYCHGDFVFSKEVSLNDWGYADSVIAGNNATVNWTDVGGDQAACGSCHGLPPQGHIAATTCNGCHGDVVDVDFNIINTDLHMNGKYDVLGSSYRP